MLAYRHLFHAGNFADVLKHIVLIELFQHMVKKEKAFSYIDTHSGAGLYHLRSDHAEKLQEYQKGIAKVVDVDRVPKEPAGVELPLVSRIALPAVARRVRPGYPGPQQPGGV